MVPPILDGNNVAFAVGSVVTFSVVMNEGRDDGTIDELEILVGGAVVFTNGDEVTLTEIFAAFTECFYD